MDGRRVLRRPIRAAATGRCRSKGLGWKLLSVFVLAVAGAGGVVAVDSHGARSDPERALAQHMNGGSAGTLTRAVDCVAVGPVGAGRFRCVLTGAHGTELVARVRVDRDRWTAAWEPLRG